MWARYEALGCQMQTNATRRSELLDKPQFNTRGVGSRNSDETGIVWCCVAVVLAQFEIKAHPNSIAKPGSRVTIAAVEALHVRTQTIPVRILSRIK